MTPDLTSARRELLKIADDLETIAFRLRGVQASLRESLAESVQLLDIAEMEPDTELRSVIDCVLKDSIEPAIRDLRDAVGDPADTIH
jgi:hypothetical protein